MPDEAHGRAGGSGDADDDFERIVAGLELSLPDDLDDPGFGDDQESEPDVFDPHLSDPLDEEDVADPERFVPPEPERLPPLDPVSRVAWAVMVGAPAMLLVAVVLALELPRAMTAGLVLGFISALVVLLVKRGNHTRGDDPDQGAVL